MLFQLVGRQRLAGCEHPPGEHVLASAGEADLSRLLVVQQGGGGVLPYQVYLMLPYLLSIAALVLVARRASYPQALMKPYRKGDRGLGSRAIREQLSALLQYVVANPSGTE
mgnify:CR=1 FL=1